MGRHRTPTVVKQARGTLQKCRTVKFEPIYEELDNIKPPDEIKDDDVAVKEWNRIAPILKSKKLITKVDLQMLINYCFLVSRMKYLRDEVKNEDIIQKQIGFGGVQLEKINPKIKVYKEMFTQMVTVSAKFGFTPSDRTKISLPKDPKADTDDLESLIKHG